MTHAWVLLYKMSYSKNFDARIQNIFLYSSLVLAVACQNSDRPNRWSFTVFLFAVFLFYIKYNCVIVIHRLVVYYISNMIGPSLTVVIFIKM